MKNYIFSLFLLNVIATQASDRKSAAGAFAVVTALQFIKAGDAQEDNQQKLTAKQEELTAKQVLQQLAGSGTAQTGKPSGRGFPRNYFSVVVGKQQQLRRNYHSPKK